MSCCPTTPGLIDFIDSGFDFSSLRVFPQVLAFLPRLLSIFIALLLVSSISNAIPVAYAFTRNLGLVANTFAKAVILRNAFLNERYHLPFGLTPRLSSVSAQLYRADTLIQLSGLSHRAE